MYKEQPRVAGAVGAGACAHGGGGSIFGGAEDTGGRVAGGIPLRGGKTHARGCVWETREGGNGAAAHAKLHEVVPAT